MMYAVFLCTCRSLFSQSIYWTIPLLHPHLLKSDCLNYKDPGVRGPLGPREQLLPKKWKTKEVFSLPVSLLTNRLSWVFKCLRNSFELMGLCSWHKE